MAKSWKDGMKHWKESTGCGGRTRVPEKWCPFIPKAGRIQAAKGAAWLVPVGRKPRKRCHSRSHGTNVTAY